MSDLWFKILETMDRMMNSGQTDMLVEAVPETLKNAVLIMKSDGYLAAPTTVDETEQQKEMFAETWKRLDRFLPDLMPEIFPEEPKKAAEEESKEEKPVEESEAPAAAEAEAAGKEEKAE